MMTKGKFKKKRWGFQPGHQPYVVERISAEREKRGYVRPNGFLQVQDGNKRENCAFLRPKSTESLVDRFAKMNLPDAERQSYRIMQLERVTESFGRSTSNTVPSHPTVQNSFNGTLLVRNSEVLFGLRVLSVHHADTSLLQKIVH